MSTPTETKCWILKEKPFGNPILDNENPTFPSETIKIPELSEGQVLLKTIYLSNDPAQRTWISPLANPKRLYLPPVQLGETMKAMGNFESR